MWVWERETVCDCPRNMLVTGSRFHLSAAFFALFIPTSCTLWPPTHLWSTVKELALCRRSASLCKPSLLAPDLGLESLSVSFWQSVWGSSLVKLLEEREDPFVIYSNEKNWLLQPSQYMQVVNLNKLKRVMESGEINLSFPPRSWFDGTEAGGGDFILLVSYNAS